MEKKFSPIQIATLRNVARLVYPIQEKVDILNKKIADISEEIGKLQQQIDVWDKPIVDMFGYSTINLIKKEKIGTRTTYVLRYPNVTPDNEETSINETPQATQETPQYGGPEEEAEQQVEEEPLVEEEVKQEEALEEDVPQVPFGPEEEASSPSNEEEEIFY